MKLAWPPTRSAARAPTLVLSHLLVLAIGLATATAHAAPAAAGVSLATAAPSASAPAGAEPLRNWFNDPYFQVRSGMRRCPTPKGPMSTEAEMRSESHSRTERGTSCWLAKKCSKQNSYLYDPDIAAAVRARFDASTALRDASLWVTVQRRIVCVEGCVAPDARQPCPPHHGSGLLQPFRLRRRHDQPRRIH